MMKIILVVLFIFCFCSVSAQHKFPLYSFQSCDSSARCFCYTDTNSVSSNSVIINFFSDSTFTVTKYRLMVECMIGCFKTTASGNYYKKGDTLILVDKDFEKGSLLKGKDYYKALAKDEELHFLPAKILIAGKKSSYISELNISRNLHQISYHEVVRIENHNSRYNLKYSPFSPQISNNRNSF